MRHTSPDNGVDLLRLTRDMFVAHTVPMDIKTLRDRLVDRRGQWTAIAAQAGVNRKTIERIVHEADYLPTMRTMIRLQGALNVSRQGKVAA